MAGEWIKMRVGLTTNPHVLRIAEHLLECGEYVEWAGLSWGIGGYPPLSEAEAADERYVALRVTRYVAVTALLKFWGYANEHAKGDSIDGIRPQDVLEITGVPGFAAALEFAGWVKFDRIHGGATLPNFDEHNTGARERTSAGAERQKRYRERKKTTVGSDVTRDVTVTEREEKRREEKRYTSVKTDLFDRFYAEYPRKVGKDAARKAFAKRSVDDVMLVAMVAAISRQGLAEKCARGESQFVPHPATWLNEGRWQDEEGAPAPAERDFV